MPDLPDSMANWLVGYRAIFTMALVVLMASWEIWRLARGPRTEDPPEAADDQSGSPAHAPDPRLRRVG